MLAIGHFGRFSGMEMAKNKGFKNKKDQNKFSPMEKGSKDWQIGVHRPWKNF